MKGSDTVKRLLAALLTAALLLSVCCAHAETQLYAINVGKADCLLLLSGSSVYMIDTGTKDSFPAVQAALAEMNIDHLDGVILTHTDKDHVGGAAQLADSGLSIDHWYASAFFADVKQKKHPAVKAAARMGMQVDWLSGGTALPLDGGTLTVLGPLSFSSKENNNSLVLRVDTADGSMLLAGDMEKPEEAELISAGLIQRVDVLKVGNHGEGDATAPDLVNLLRPSVAIISTNSDEEPDTPSSKVLKALKAVGAQVYVTQYAKGGILTTLRNGEVTVEMK